MKQGQSTPGRTQTAGPQECECLKVHTLIHSVTVRPPYCFVFFSFFLFFLFFFNFFFLRKKKYFFFIQMVFYLFRSWKDFFFFLSPLIWYISNLFYYCYLKHFLIRCLDQSLEKTQNGCQKCTNGDPVLWPPTELQEIFQWFKLGQECVCTFFFMASYSGMFSLWLK